MLIFVGCENNVYEEFGTRIQGVLEIMKIPSYDTAGKGCYSGFEQTWL